MVSMVNFFVFPDHLLMGKRAKGGKGGGGEGGGREGRRGGPL